MRPAFRVALKLWSIRLFDFYHQLVGLFDLLFLDAAKEEYYGYLKAAEPKLSADAVVVADNVGMFRDRMTVFLDYLRQSGRYRSKTYDFGSDAIEVAQRVIAV